MKDLKGSENFLNGKFKTIIYLHGCAGHWVGTAKRIDFYAKNGYAVIAPPSMARKKYAQSCDTSVPRGGMYRSVLKIRQIDAENAILKAKQLSWTDNENIFLVGLSEGGITTATYTPKNIESSIKGRVIEGWTCNAGWEEYQGVNTPYNEPVLSLVAKYDPWFQAEYLKGHCGQFKNNNPLSKSIIIDDGTQLSKGHGLMHDKKIQKITLDFLKKIRK
jgi:dienelactone hydrolase